MWFYFYAPQTCLKEKRILYQAEWTRIEIAAERIRTVLPVCVHVKLQGKEFILKDGIIADGGYRILRTNAGEEILLVIKIQEQNVFCYGKRCITNREVVSIGNHFRYEIFYEYFSFLREKKLLIYQSSNQYVLECVSASEERKCVGIYVNGKAVKEKMLLEKGDRIDVLGLTVLVLPQTLLCISYYGTLRIAERKECIGTNGSGEIKDSQTDYTIKNRFLPQEKIEKEERELLLPEKEKKDFKQPLFLIIGPSLTMVIPTFLMMLTGKIFGEYGSGLFYKMSAVVTVASAALSVFWMLLNDYYHNKVREKENTSKACEYAAYLQRVQTELEDKMQCIKKRMEDKNPTVSEIVGQKWGSVFWNRYPQKEEETIKWVRIGKGKILSPITLRVSEQRQIVEQSICVQEAYKIAEQFRYLKEIPIKIALTEGNSIGLMGQNIYPVLLQILIQVIAHYGGHMLKIVYFYHENYREEQEIAECLKWLPQVWQDSGKRRFLAGNVHEAGELLPFLTEKIQNQKEETGQIREMYLFVIANEALIKGEPIENFLTGREKGKGYYALFCGLDKEQLPVTVSQLINRTYETDEMICYEEEVWEKQNIVLEECEVMQAAKYMRSLAKSRENKEYIGAEIPEKVSFLELYQCSSTEELHSLSRWEENRVSERIRVPIGIGMRQRCIYLDIHEKFHGPHGLIAGTTGCGKSELLQTYLLSLAVSFSPEEINFFIIDYKGGGLGIGLGRLLHCAGVISNLSGAQIKRALLSLKSENTRRQKMLGKAGVSHIDEYGRLYRERQVAEPMPHLILVVDEFAELKKEEPEFMQEIISIAQIGRSLGIHLILATQKPAGTIDDKIWSNSRFRLCLRVAERQDSMDMLKRPEAAYLTGVGRGYLQVGNNEIFEALQTGYSKTPYETAGKVTKAVLLSVTGKKFEKKAAKQKEQESQMERVIDYLNELGKQHGYQKAKPLWMQELPQTILLEELIRKETDLYFCIGKYDDPYRQQQKELYYTPMEGHLCICGMPFSGKSTFLQTLLWQICRRYSPLQLQFLLIATESAAVGCYTQMPHCLGYIKQPKEAEIFFYHLQQMLRRRKKELGGIGFWQAQKKDGKDLCPILVIVDDYGTFREATEDYYYGMMEQLFREGIQLGIYVVLTAFGIGGGEIQGRLFEKVTQTVALTMNDKMQYADVLRQYQIPVEPAANSKGRGLCRIDGRILEFQVPLFSKTDDYERIRQVEELAEEWKQKTKESAESMPRIFMRLPDNPSWEGLQNAWKNTDECKEKLPLGYQTGSGCIQSIKIKEHSPFWIIGEMELTLQRLTNNLIDVMLQNKMSVAVYTKHTETVAENMREKVCFLRNADDFSNWQQCVSEQNIKKWVLVVDEPADFMVQMQRYDSSVTGKIQLLEQQIMQKQLFLLIKCSSRRENELYGTFWYESAAKAQCGIYLGSHIAMQRILSFDDLGYAAMEKDEKEDIGYLKLGCESKTKKILIPKSRIKEMSDDTG